MEHLDRVLDGDHVHFAVVVDPVDHRREGGGLPRAGRTGDEHEAAVLSRQSAHHFGQPEIVERGGAGAHETEDHGDRAPLEEDVHAEAPQALDAIGEVGFVIALEVLVHVRAHDRHRHVGRDRGGELLLALEPVQGAVHAYTRSGAALHVQVGAFRLGEGAEEAIESFPGHVVESTPLPRALTGNASRLGGK